MTLFSLWQHKLLCPSRLHIFVGYKSVWCDADVHKLRSACERHIYAVTFSQAIHWMASTSCLTQSGGVEELTFNKIVWPLVNYTHMEHQEANSGVWIKSNTSTSFKLDCYWYNIVLTSHEKTCAKLWQESLF